MEVRTETITRRILPSKPQYDIITSDCDVNLFLAGQGSGKSHCAGIVSAELIKDFPNVRGFIGANTYGQLTDSTLARIRPVWQQNYGWSEYTKANPNGNY